MNTELMSLLGQVGELSYAERAEDIRHGIKAFFASKKSLSQAEYIQQLEKNVPYAMACCLSIQAALVEHIHTARPQFKNEEEYLGWIDRAKSIARTDALPVIDYLAGRGVASNNNLTRYFTTVQGMKQSGQMAKYLDEMEFQIKFYQSILVVTQMFVYIIAGTGNERVASSFRAHSNKSELSELLSQRIKFEANRCIDNISVA